MTNYGYARVSSVGQKVSGNSLEDQVSQLKAAGCSEENIFREQYTGATMDRPEFDRVLKKLQPGDKLIVTKLDRIARTATSGFETVKVYSASENSKIRKREFQKMQTTFPKSAK